MADYEGLSYQELVTAAKEKGLETHKISKAKLIEGLIALEDQPEAPVAEEEAPVEVAPVEESVDPVSDPVYPDLDAYFVGNRWVYVPKGSPPPEAPVYKPRLFDQKGVLYTGEERSPLTRAYNLEQSIAINDVQLEIGAKLRGQNVGDASRGQVNRDAAPEGGY